MTAEHLANLDDYVTGELGEDDAAAFEERLFAAPDDDATLAKATADYERSRRLIEWLSKFARLTEPVTAADVTALRSAGLEVHEIDVLADQPTVIDAWSERTQIVVFVCRTDVRGYDDVEVEVTNPDGTPIKTFRGCLGEPDTGNLYAICAEPLAKLAFGEKRRISRVTGVRDGKRELITTFDTRPA